MSNKSVLLHVCSIAMLVLAVIAVTGDLYGDLPDCDGTQQGLSYMCGQGKDNCADKTPEVCDDPASVCVESQSVTGACIGGGTASQLCQSQTAICTKSFYCAYDGEECFCSSAPALDPDGNPIVSTTNNSGANVSCLQKGG